MAVPQMGPAPSAQTGILTSKPRGVYYVVFVLVICAFFLLSMDNYLFFCFASVTVIGLRFAWQVDRLGKNEEKLLITVM